MKTPLEYNGRSSSDPEELAIGRSHELTDLITHFAKQQPISEFYIWFKELTILDQNFPNSNRETLFGRRSTSSGPVIVVMRHSIRSGESI